MGRKVFVDTNVALDLLEGREPFKVDAERLFSLADRGRVDAHVSSLSFANMHYVLRKHLGDARAAQVLRKFRSLVKVVSLDQGAVDFALQDQEFPDYEDALQYFSALQNGMDVIITRNLKHFKHTKIPCMTAGEFLRSR